MYEGRSILQGSLMILFEARNTQKPLLTWVSSIVKWHYNVLVSVSSNLW